MVPRPHIVARTATFSVLLASFVLTGCHSSSKLSAPTLAFSKVPAADQESPYKTDIFERNYKTDIIEGRATGSRPGQRIVLYAQTDGRWGVCRQSGQPFTNIETDGRWKASVHLGIQYAALLVDPTYNPPEQTESLPIVGNGVVALAVVNGEGAAPVLPSPKILNFSGYEWTTSTGHELDVELGRWGYLDNTNVHYVVQPYYVPANFVAFRAPPGLYTHSFRWEPGKVTFSTVAGSGNTTGGRVINQHVFTSGVPSPEGESVRIALYVFHQGHIPLKNENEVIIDKFEYLP